MDTSYQEAIMRTHRIPDAHEYVWYGVKMRSEDAVRMVHWFGRIIEGNLHEIADIFAVMALDPSKSSVHYYKHPNYTELLRWLLDTYVQHSQSFIMPTNASISASYRNAIEYREQRFRIGFDETLDVTGICQLAADASGYFYWAGAFGRTNQFEQVMQKHGCKNDFTNFETGRPQELTEAISVLKRYGILPADYAFETE